MYQILCDDYILYDPRDDDLIVLNPKCKLKENTVGEGSFTILPTHPYYGSFRKLKSIFEIREDNTPIFRGRMIRDGLDFDNLHYVDLEGVLGFTNDTIIPPFNFPGDFPAADNAENVVEYFLGWILEQHNSRCEDWQKLKLGNVTVSDPNNYITRSSDKFASTWDTLKSKLFNSSLGGYLCARYESDGNYVDYLASYDLTNTQRIRLGENLLDITNESDGSETCSAILPVGKEGLTIASLPDGDLNTDLVKDGLYIYSKSGVESFGWVCVSPDESTWDDVTDVNNLKTKAIAHLTGTASKLSNTITIKFCDLHLTDAEVQSFRIHRNVIVDSPVHGVSSVSYRLSELDIDIQNPQNSVITIGDTSRTLADINADREDNVDEKIESTKNELKDFVTNKTEDIEQRIEGIDGTYFYIKYSQYADGRGMTDTPNDSTLYMGTCSTNQTTAPTDPAKYTWCLVRGQDGTNGTNGTNGSSSYFHVKYSDDGKTFTGSLLSTDFSEWVSGNYGSAGFVPSSTWVLSYPEVIPVLPETYTVQTNCSDNKIKASIVQYDAEGTYVGQISIAYAEQTVNFAEYPNTSFVRLKLAKNDMTYDAYKTLWENGDLSPKFYRVNGLGEELGAYMGTLVDSVEEDSTNFDDYTWKKIVGEDGKDGIDGIDGTDGESSYFYVKFSANANGNPMTETPTSDTKYMGVCSTTSPTAPTEHSAYSWTQCRGNDGTNGTPGEPGEDGRTQYLHIKYSDDGQTFTENNGEELGAWIGTLVDFNEEDSMVFSDYTWKRFTEDVDEELEGIKQTIHEQSTSLTNTCREIVLSALESYVQTDGYEEFRKTVESELELLANKMTVQFTETTSKIEEVNGELQSQLNTITKYFTFDIDGLTIGQVDNPNKVVIDNDHISILVSERPVLEFNADGTASIPALTISGSLNLLGLFCAEDGNNINCDYIGEV